MTTPCVAGTVLCGGHSHYSYHATVPPASKGTFRAQLYFLRLVSNVLATLSHTLPPFVRFASPHLFTPTFQSMSSSYKLTAVVRHRQPKSGPRVA